PAVSLKGSPTVSPTTAAACAGVPLPMTCPLSSWSSPDSMYFFALSHAPPPLLSTVARMTPAIVPTISIAASASALSRMPTRIGAPMASSPGAIMLRSAEAVQAVGTMRGLLRGPRHRCDAVGVVGDRAERIHREDERRAHEHSHRGDRGAVDPAVRQAGRSAPLLAKEVREEKRERDRDRRARGGLESHRDARDDRRRRARLRGLGDLLDRAPAPRRVV